MSTFMIASDRISNQLASKYLEAIANQEVAWFDQTSAASIASEITASIDAIKAGIGEKVGTLISQTSLFVGGTVAALVRGPQLALVLIAVDPLVAAGVGILGRGIMKMMVNSRKNYIRAGTIAEEALSAIRTVTAFGGEKKSAAAYEQLTDEARKANTKAFKSMGHGAAYTFAVTYVGYSIGFLFATYLMDEKITNWSTGEPYNVGNVISVFFAFLTTSSVLGNIPNHYKVVYEARVAAGNVFAIIGKTQDLNKTQGPNPIKSEEHSDYAKIRGDIRLKDVTFRYPTRPEVTVLNNINLKFPENRSVALVGETGCGKSTIIQLLERFYEPEYGSITIGDVDISRCDPVLLRKKIALVSQEPVLFGSSILENILQGRPNATEEDVIDVCKKANAWNFIKTMEQGMHSYVGQRGGQLSGGQKQRIAIARALIKNPIVLLLDEATSALDNISEKEVQETLNSLTGSVTQIMIAHRLSTIKQCDNIYMIKEGQVFEEGDFDTLKNRQGAFAGLLQYQQAVEEERRRSEAELASISIENSAIVMSETKVHVPSRKPSVYTKISAAEPSRNGAVTTLSKKDQRKESWFLRTLRDYRQYRWTLITGCALSGLMGLCSVLQGYLLGSIIDTMQDPEASDFATVAYRISIIYVVLAVAVYLIVWGRVHTLTLLGEIMVKGLRMKLFTKLLRMPISYFDLPENKTGALTSQLELSTGAIRRISGGVLGNAFQAFFGYVGSLMVAYFYNWLLSICLTLLSPLLVIRAIAEKAQLKGGFTKRDKQAIKEAGALVSEGVTNIRTVHSLNIQNDFVQKYTRIISGSDKELVSQSRRSGFIMGLGEFAPRLMFAVAFLVGAYMIKNDRATVVEVMIPVFVFVTGVRTLADFLASITEFSAARETMVHMYEFEDTPSPIDPCATGGVILRQDEVQGEILLKDVYFTYPTRAEPVLRGLNLSIPAGQTVALVGPSGCGKSTIISLMLRFYDPSLGQISIDHHDIRDINIKNLRKIMSLVAQEPVLFDASIRDNIKYGCPDASDEEMIEAAEKANARKFIENDEIEGDDIENSGQGYDRNVGLGGSKLSGGQKQRIAIARAIIRKPKILLLDEATSALDSQSEAIVQDALNSVMKDMTTLVIAHRISTIESADKIAVIKEGLVVEQGAYHELLQKRDHFYSLAKALK
eukprot:CAMPEP_0115019666 /NCGR_PEP_ID=MMETSP0216-20121206/29597_1 /TAXON_ID=223996 /ORGANISM="Protocruzia adherens, Strain Boccale" /LENGTH=1168 /DNA_ID=CAMNT_0002391215 /DNA_START=774 /DNA_END=4280 /DNA_ORIENTATION=-